jgi:hypothetical protein
MKVPTLLVAAACARAPEPPTSPCEEDPRAEPLVVGSVFDGDVLSVRVAALDPDPPEVGENTWEIDVLGPDPVAGCSLVVTPWMPDHGHGGAVDTATEVDPGRWRLEGLDLRMGGFWQVAMGLDCGEVGAESVDVLVCVDA